MRAGLPKLEPDILARWKSEGLYQRLLSHTADGERYILHDGPPYANGNVHLGTALNKIIKDVVVKRQLMAGRHAPYIPGWDCHGMPIEHQVLRELGKDARTMSQLEIRRRCRAFAEKFYRIQREQFQRLGVLGDWDDPYLTMSPDYEAGIIRMFRRLVERGFIYRGLRPVHVVRRVLHGARRSRGRVRRSHVAVDLRALSDAAERRRGGRVVAQHRRRRDFAGGGRKNQCSDLDDDAVDSAGQSGGVFQSDARLRRHRRRRRAVHRRGAPGRRFPRRHRPGWHGAPPHRSGSVVARRPRCVPAIRCSTARRAPCSKRT